MLRTDAEAGRLPFQLAARALPTPRPLVGERLGGRLSAFAARRGHEPLAGDQARSPNWDVLAEARLPEELWPPAWPDAAEGHRIGAALAAWTRASRRPLVLFLDEIDALEDDALTSVLRQLRDGYSNRPTSFPHSLALIGLRDVRDYKVASGGSRRLGTSSPFNIKAESLTLRGFMLSEVGERRARDGESDLQRGRPSVAAIGEPSLSATDRPRVASPRRQSG